MKFLKSFFSSLVALHFSVVNAASQLPIVDLGYTVQQATLNVSMLLFALRYRVFRFVAARVVWILLILPSPIT
jgi:hypothetical protein